MAIDVQLVLNDKLFLRDPQSTSLGKNIIRQSIVLLEQNGFEDFTFKKLAIEINSTEASVYRYFENKHMLMLYLVSWYWEWVSYQLDINSRNIFDSISKLEIAIDCIANPIFTHSPTVCVDLKLLHHVVVTEGTKTYHTKLVDKENKSGLFLPYLNLAGQLVELFENISPDYPYPKLLASTLMEMANSQVFYAQHINQLTDIRVKGEDYNELKNAMKHFAFRMLEID